MGFFVYGIGYKNADRTQPLYVGQTKETLNTRWSKHKSSCKLHPNQNLHRFIVKNGGEEYFEMFLIEEVSVFEQLKVREKYYIVELKPPLNIQHNLGNTKKIIIGIENTNKPLKGPFVSLVLFTKWLINDFKIAAGMCSLKQ
jgi:hypothetical protein